MENLAQGDECHVDEYHSPGDAGAFLAKVACTFAAVIVGVPLLAFVGFPALCDHLWTGYHTRQIDAGAAEAVRYGEEELGIRGCEATYEDSSPSPDTPFERVVHGPVSGATFSLSGKGEGVEVYVVYEWVDEREEWPLVGIPKNLPSARVAVVTCDGVEAIVGQGESNG